MKTVNRCRTIFSPRLVVASPVGEVSMTESQYLADCDIVNIMKRCACGDTSLVRTTPPIFADVSNIGDFSNCMRKVKEANDAFMELPSELRKRFGNDPTLLVDFLADSANDEEAIKLGLKVAPPTPSTSSTDGTPTSSTDGTPTA